MELSRPIPRPHMAVTLPEILREITSFLPNYDLHKSVTLVSRGWEDAARKRLLSRVCVNLTPENVAGYLEATKIRGKHHKHVFLRDFNFENLSREESKKLENFNFTATTPINKLRLDYFPYGWFIHPRVVTLFSHCPRLESVTFSPKTLRTQTLKSSPPKDVSFPKVVAFEISLASDYSEFEEVMRSIKLPDFLGIISIFPNLKILRCTALSQNIMEYFLSDKTSIREISVRLRNTDPLISIQNRSIFLTGIEFLVGIAANSRNYDVILAIFADQLEKLKLVAEYNLPRRLFELADVQVLVTINLPKVLPRLKCLEIGIVREASFGSRLGEISGRRAG
ncbi:uncharacterized protein LOC118436887 [Folsomia candida]|uniref:uncharacterized protein LOC118436887 n=1 Tax=Folsomia candida TaxID=158441 RepID=UPI001604EA90|nr:uncharacterized protein LOC118436887 [Folsomia candida]